VLALLPGGAGLRAGWLETARLGDAPPEFAAAAVPVVQAVAAIASTTMAAATTGTAPTAPNCRCLLTFDPRFF
jgi:hypothetical protein